MRRSLADLIHLLIAAVLVYVLCHALEARGQVPDGVELDDFRYDCGQSICSVPKESLLRLMLANKKMGEALREKAKEVPKCGTLEVLPKEPAKKKLVLPDGPKNNS